MSDIHFPEPFAALTSAVVPVSWWTRAAAWSDLTAHRHPRRQLIVYLLLAGPGAIATGLGIGFAAAGDHLSFAPYLTVAGAILLSLTLGSVIIGINRLLRPATPATIAALRQLVEPALWQHVAAAAARHCRAAPGMPVMPALLFAWLDKAVDIERGQTASEVIVAAQARAFN